jgi:predicted Fe-Mo cluster-binding NifX family protein
MNLMITSLGESLESPIDPRFGRARYFVIYNTSSNRWTVQKNNQIHASAKTAETEACKIAVNCNVSVIATGHCRLNSLRSLAENKIVVFFNSLGSVKDKIQYFMKKIKNVKREFYLENYSN